MNPENLAKLTPNQRIAFKLLHSVLDISISWRAIKALPIEDPVAWIKATYLLPAEHEAINAGNGPLYIPVHAPSGSAQIVTNLGALLLEYYAETGTMIHGLTRKYADIPGTWPQRAMKESDLEWPEVMHNLWRGIEALREEFAFMEWLAERGLKLKKGKWITLEKLGA